MSQSADETDPPLRRLPTQQRSRERVEKMLAAASDLIAEQGSDALKMNDVARRAGVSIGSLYQYFPDKSAIVHTLAERTFAECRRCIEEGLDAARTPEDLGDAFATLFEEYYALFLAEPVIRDIRAAIMADRTLQALELADSRANGALLAAALARVHGTNDPSAYETRAFYLMHLGETTMRLATAVPRDEGDRLVALYTDLSRTMLKDMG